ncbi:MAG: redox-sensing transcriptional repressor Rex [Oscillospiraceae bacterium]|jgi:redox-sensing transcriptional repressor|nr:redox-sensing transcriptional repressor Rex [Oscillospiraceae bacterium]
MSKSMISSPVIKRLPRYYRFLGELEKQGVIRISSRELSEKMGLTASQIRQDLNCFGGFGQQGYGYNVQELHEAIGKIIGIASDTRTVIIGAGNLGSAIAMHIDFKKAGFSLIGIFDSDPEKTGQIIAGIPVAQMNLIESFCNENKPECAVLCIPKESAEEIVDKLIRLGIKAFWNYSHYDINVDGREGILVQNVHLSDSLMTLSYGLHNFKKEK